MNFIEGNEFQFIDCNSAFESKAKIRNRVMQLSNAKGFNLIMGNFALQALLGEENRIGISL